MAGITKRYTLKGTVKWFMHDRLDSYNKWSHQLFLDDESLKLIMRFKDGTDGIQGILNNLKKDEDGYFVRISRDPQKLIKGLVVSFKPPTIYREDGISPFDGGVGNGSEVLTEIDWYTYKLKTVQDGKQGSAIRWINSSILNLVPYSPESYDSDTMSRAEQLAKREEKKTPLW